MGNAAQVERPTKAMRQKERNLIEDIEELTKEFLSTLISIKNQFLEKSPRLKVSLSSTSISTGSEGPSKLDISLKTIYTNLKQFLSSQLYEELIFKISLNPKELEVGIPKILRTISDVKDEKRSNQRSKTYSEIKSTTHINFDVLLSDTPQNLNQNINLQIPSRRVKKNYTTSCSLSFEVRTTIICLAENGRV